MNIVIVDPDQAERNTLGHLLSCRCMPESIQSFADPLMALKYGANNRVDALYAVTKMKRLGGLELATILRKFNPGIRLNFITDTEQDRIDAMRLMAETCIPRPVTAQSLRDSEDEESPDL